MPKYKVKLSLGSRSLFEYVEANSIDNVIKFYNSTTSMQLVDIFEIERARVSKSIDNPTLYRDRVKFLTYSGNSFRVVLLYGVKSSHSISSITAKLLSNLLVNGKRVDRVIHVL